MSSERRNKNASEQFGISELSVLQIATELWVKIPDPMGIDVHRQQKGNYKRPEVPLKSEKEEIQKILSCKRGTIQELLGWYIFLGSLCRGNSNAIFKVSLMEDNRRRSSDGH